MKWIKEILKKYFNRGPTEEDTWKKLIALSKANKFTNRFPVLKCETICIPANTLELIYSHLQRASELYKMIPKENLKLLEEGQFVCIKRKNEIEDILKLKEFILAMKVGKDKDELETQKFISSFNEQTRGNNNQAL